MDKESLKKLRDRAFPKEYTRNDYPFDIRHCPNYEGYIPKNLEHEVCGWCKGEGWIDYDMTTEPCKACGGKIKLR